MFRLTSFLERRSTFTHTEFIDYWWREHSPIAAALPELRRNSTTRPMAPEVTPYDGVAKLYFDDRDAFDTVLGPEAMNDVTNFIARTSRFHLRETVHVDREEHGDHRVLDSETPVTDQAMFPVASFAAFQRSDHVDASAFGTAVTDTFERIRADPAVRWFATATPTDDDDVDVVMKRTVDSVAASRSPLTAFDPMRAVADVTHEFVGYERTVVDDRCQTNR